ncbi:ThiF family adenylyltransferase [Hyphomonas sp.]|uniref:ThiF family adenylyltransferase n=1 Tax=Hyphomonas sp. TaxID=87 RepID=UPI003F6F050D
MTLHNITGPDQLHRLMKQALDNGTAATLEDAICRFSGYKVAIRIDAQQARERRHQAVLLTAVALATRVFLGGVFVEGNLDQPHKTDLLSCDTLKQACIDLGAKLTASDPTTPVIQIGGDPNPNPRGFHIRTETAGWRGGIVPACSDARAKGNTFMPLAGMLAAGLAINEAFLFVNGEMPAAGHRRVGLSLWNPSPATDWLINCAAEPALRYLPSDLWIIGLGHLGQAYLWGLGLLPYGRPASLNLVLQDTDKITASTHSTSILTKPDMTGQYKTRALAKWAERRGFSTNIHERLFADDFRRQTHEPAIALCGIDNAMGRRALDQTGFEMVVEAGLGHGYQNFRSMRLHVLPGTRPAAQIWREVPGAQAREERAAYKQLLNDGVLDQCGITLLAGKAVGAPFVGAVAAALALSEILRLLHGGQVHQLVDLDLMCPEHRMAKKNRGDFSTFNPGYVGTVHQSS